MKTIPSPRLGSRSARATAALRSPQLDRRELIVGASASALFGFATVGCGAAGESELDPGEELRKDAGRDARAATSDAGAAADANILAPTCGKVTEASIEGPFFTPGSPARTSLVTAATLGQRLRLSGRVLSPACVPIAGAIVDFWQADHLGVYDNNGFTFRGHQTTGASGEYTLDTIIPGRYLNGAQYRPAHLHVKVAAPGRGLLTTQLYFEGDPFNGIDPFLHPSLIMALKNAGAVTKATFDFVVA